MSIVIDGRKMADQLKMQLFDLGHAFQKAASTKPGLAVLRVGEDSASKIYVQTKHRQAQELDYHFEEHHFPEGTSSVSLENKIQKLNRAPHIHGIILQLPLPPHLEVFRLLSLIDPSKDVDGLHPSNAGRLFEVFSSPFIPCAALACFQLIQSVNSYLEGKNVGIIGCSFLVGRPLAMLMLKQNCTVWMGHVKTKNLPTLCKTADILISAIGSPNFIQGEWIKKEAIVIDVGINHLPSGKITGDVNFSSALQRVKAITPVPGGVGPMTVAFLLLNTLKAAYQSIGKEFPLNKGY